MQPLGVTLDGLEVASYQVPTDGPEADGTLSWDSTTMVIAKVYAGGRQGLGYTYGNQGIAQLITGLLTKVVVGQDVMNIPGLWLAMVKAIRNQGRPGLSSMAIAAVDTALWDLKARLLDVPLVVLLGAVCDAVPVYGSGGFTSYSLEQLRKQLSGWVESGIPRVKMKIGSHPDQDIARVQAARDAIGSETALFVDANGAYSRKQAVAMAEVFADYDVSWFEEPVSSDDLEGLRLLRNRLPAGMEVSAGEYGYDLNYFRRMLEADAVDVLQADATRCAGITGFLHAGILCQAYQLPFSSHTSPNLHAHPACALPALRHMEYFHDHVRIEELFFEGALKPEQGMLRPDMSRPGLGLTLRESAVAKYAI